MKHLFSTFVLMSTVYCAYPTEDPFTFITSQTYRGQTTTRTIKILGFSGVLHRSSTEDSRYISADITKRTGDMTVHKVVTASYYFEFEAGGQEVYQYTVKHDDPSKSKEIMWGEARKKFGKLAKLVAQGHERQKELAHKKQKVETAPRSIAVPPIVQAANTALPPAYSPEDELNRLRFVTPPHYQADDSKRS